MYFCLLSQPALYLVSSLLGQVGALLFFQGLMVQSSPTPAPLSLPVHSVHYHEAGAVYTYIRYLGLAVCSGHVTRPLCFLRSHDSSIVCFLGQGKGLIQSFRYNPVAGYIYTLGALVRQKTYTIIFRAAPNQKECMGLCSGEPRSKLSESHRVKYSRTMNSKHHNLAASHTKTALSSEVRPKASSAHPMRFKIGQSYFQQ